MTRATTQTRDTASGLSPAVPGSPRTASERGPESVHIVVGHSLLIRTPSRVKRILTGNPAVIESVLTSPAGTGDHRQGAWGQQSDAVG